MQLNAVSCEVMEDDDGETDPNVTEENALQFLRSVLKVDERHQVTPWIFEESYVDECTNTSSVWLDELVTNKQKTKYLNLIMFDNGSDEVILYEKIGRDENCLFQWFYSNDDERKHMYEWMLQDSKNAKVVFIMPFTIELRVWLARNHDDSQVAIILDNFKLMGSEYVYGAKFDDEFEVNTIIAINRLQALYYHL